MTTNRNVRKSQGIHTYSSLEARQLLATMIYGTTGNDEIEIRYVDDLTIDVFRQGVLEENVGVADGLIINLTDGDRDQLKIDPRVQVQVSVVNAEKIEMIGGDNTFSISELDNGRIAGTINENIGFADAVRFESGEGDDTFVINTRIDQAEIKAGDGNDHFVLYAQSEINQPLDPTATLYGEGGDDYFSFQTYSSANFDGGSGTDAVDYRKHQVSTEVLISESSEQKIDRILGSDIGGN
ncbi:MAG: hypothetical protein AAF623_18610, partial [Planctomycetota bacterium]